MSLRYWLLASCVAINLYLLGVMVVFARVTYPSFGLVNRTDLAAYYSGFNQRIAVPVVLPEFLAFLAVLPLFVQRPPCVPLWSVVAALTSGVLYFAITFAWHLPSHRALASGDNGATALAPLLASQVARTWVQAGKCALLVWMCAAARGSTL